MKMARYIGSYPSLQDETALIQDDPEGYIFINANKFVIAQFDSWDAYRGGEQLAIGWHLFERAEFKELEG